MEQTFFDFPSVDIDSNNSKLGDLCAGKKAILVVNVASKWGLTDSNYKELVQMHE